MDDRRLETMIGNLLRIGVLLAATVVFAGGAFYLVQHHADLVSYRSFVPGADGVRTLPGIVHSALHFESAGWIQFGLLLLIATPVARVGLAAVGFAMERDRLYVVVSLIVLLILVASLLRAV
jgi:uncharacterized membrane protein